MHIQTSPTKLFLLLLALVSVAVMSVCRITLHLSVRSNGALNHRQFDCFVQQLIQTNIKENITAFLPAEIMISWVIDTMVQLKLKLGISGMIMEIKASRHDRTLMVRKMTRNFAWLMHNHCTNLRKCYEPKLHSVLILVFIVHSWQYIERTSFTMWQHPTVSITCLTTHLVTW